VQVPVRVIQLRKSGGAELVVEWPASWPGDEEALVGLVEWMLGWDVDTEPVLEAIRSDPVISHLADPLEGLKPFTQPSLFEALVKAILQQQVTYRFACQVARDLVLAYGPSCQLGGQRLRGFPGAERVAKLSEEELRACRAGYKASYLSELARLVVSGQLDLESMAQLETEEALQALDRLRGVGRWTAELTVLTGLRRLEVFPCDDLGIRNLISNLYMGGRPAKRKDVERVAQRWGEQAAMVLYFLMCAQVLKLV